VKLEVKSIASRELNSPVVKRPKLSKYFDYKDLELLIESINQYGEFYSVNSKVEICRDEKDNFLLALAKESKANYYFNTETGESIW